MLNMEINNLEHGEPAQPILGKFECVRKTKRLCIICFQFARRVLFIAFFRYRNLINEKPNVSMCKRGGSCDRRDFKTVRVGLEKASGQSGSENPDPNGNDSFLCVNE
jgi:hypothetical protein